MNRRMPNGTSGGVGAGEGNLPGDPMQFYSRWKIIDARKTSKTRVVPTYRLAHIETGADLFLRRSMA